jgi:hypothetical protein
MTILLFILGGLQLYLLQRATRGSQEQGGGIAIPDTGAMREIHG